MLSVAECQEVPDSWCRNMECTRAKGEIMSIGTESS